MYWQQKALLMLNFFFPASTDVCDADSKSDQKVFLISRLLILAIGSLSVGS